MLVLSRELGQSLMIGEDIAVTLVEIRRNKVRLGVAAPDHVQVHRLEVFEEIKRQIADGVDDPLRRVDPGAVALIRYANHRGEVADRRIVPGRIWLGEAEWHPGRQWLLEAFDAGKAANRTFAMAGIRSWGPVPGPGA